MSRSPIRVMSADLSLKIAAGEVVDRPASAVKELLDNAIDAGARSVKIEIRDGGLKLIRVTDDGIGIARDELQLAFTSHATSKIEDLRDLESLTTLGFRGEALPSIAAVSRVEVLTRTEDDAVGTRYVVEHGVPIEERSYSTPCGLRISVHNLFANVPARRKFVRSLRAESGQIQTVIAHYTLAQPGVQLSLIVDDRPVFHSPGTGDLLDAVAAVYGAQMSEHMLAVDAADSGVAIDGYVSKPCVTRQNRTGITVFVNGRPVQNRSLVFALEEAYSGFVMTGRHPLAAVHLRLHPRDVDVNVHPAKSEVRFARDREIHGMLHRAVANILVEGRLESRTLSGESSPLAGVDQGEQALFPSVEPVGAEPQTFFPKVPVLRVFGQAHATFIIAEGPEGLYMIDQHAAHERVLFDRFDQQLAQGDVRTQPMLEPAVLELDPDQLAAMEVNRELLEQVGFVLEPFGTSACLIRSIPILERAGQPGDLVIEILNELKSSLEPTAARERALAALACKAAVKAGQPLEMREMRELVEQLERTLRPSTCPHGRPTMIHVSNTQLEREFGRR